MHKPITETVKKILFWDRCFFYLCKTSIYFVISLFLFFFGYLIYKSSLGVWHFGLTRIFATFDFQLNNLLGGVSFWAPLFITLLISFLVIVFSLPFSLKCAIWLTFSSKKKTSKFLTFWLELFSTLPSIIFGLFAKNYVAPAMSWMFGFNDSSNVLVAIVILIFMSSPIIVSLLVHSLKKNYDLIDAASALGINREHSIYKLVLPNIKHTILTSIVVILGKVISESVALSFLLANENYSSVFDEGFFNIFTSRLNTVAALISDNFFSDGANIHGQNLLFAFGTLLLIFFLFINNMILMSGKKSSTNISKRKTRCFIFERTFKKTIALFLSRLLRKKIEWNYINFYNLKILFFKKKTKKPYLNVNKYVLLRIRKRRWANCVIFWRKMWEVLSISVMFMFFATTFLSIFVEGIIAFSNSDAQLLSFGSNSLLRAFINTFVIVVLSISLTFFISLFCAAYLSEYSQNSKCKKHIFSLLNVATSVPSIMYGLFGLSFFLYGLELSASGGKGKSLLAGILTISLFIFPHQIKGFYSHFDSIPASHRDASYALGISKHITFFKIILPKSKDSIRESTVLNFGKISGETAPLFLTAGLNSMNFSHLMYPGQTLTTRIYAQLFVSDLNKAARIMFEAAFLLLIIKFLLLYLIKYLIPTINNLCSMSREQIILLAKKQWTSIQKRVNTVFHKIFLIGKDVYIV